MAVSKAYENPLLGHARMRAMFRGLVEVRALSTLAAKRDGLPRTLEACWVGTAIDLQEGDLVSGVHAGAYGGFLRAVGVRKTDRAATSGEFQRVIERIASARAFAGTASDEACCAIGQALAVKAVGGKQVVVAYVGADALNATEWKRVLQVACEGALPLVLVAIPAMKAKAAVDLSAVSGKVSGAQIPVISVDAGDAVALYRVMQETCVRARADGGVVVVECVRFGTDPVRLLAAQLRTKGICTERWISGVEKSVEKLGLPMRVPLGWLRKGTLCRCSR